MGGRGGEPAGGWSGEPVGGEDGARRRWQLWPVWSTVYLRADSLSCLPAHTLHLKNALTVKLIPNSGTNPNTTLVAKIGTHVRDCFGSEMYKPYIHTLSRQNTLPTWTKSPLLYVVFPWAVPPRSVLSLVVSCPPYSRMFLACAWASTPLPSLWKHQKTAYERAQRRLCRAGLL